MSVCRTPFACPNSVAWTDRAGGGFIPATVIVIRVVIANLPGVDHLARIPATMSADPNSNDSNNSPPPPDETPPPIDQGTSADSSSKRSAPPDPDRPANEDARKSLLGKRFAAALVDGLIGGGLILALGAFHPALGSLGCALYPESS